MRVPYLDLPLQWEQLQDEVLPRLGAIYARAAFILGDEVAAFEAEFAEYCRCRHAVGVGSGLDALRLALRALGVGPGDEVITQANTFIATTLAITALGARPVLVDVQEDSYNFDPERLAAAITARTKAVIPVHMYGQPVDMDPIRTLAARHGLPILEDASHAHGADLGRARVGGLGTLAAFSLYPGKNLGAFGDAGIITTDDPELDARLRRLRNYGCRTKYEHVELGENSRLDTVHAAVLSVKLLHLDAWNRRRQEVAARYSVGLAGVGDLALPVTKPDRTHVYHVFAVRTGRRAALIEHLTAQGIQTNINFPVPIHLHQAHRGFGWRRGDFPVAERLCAEQLSLPVFPEMTDAQVDYVIERIAAFYANA